MSKIIACHQPNFIPYLGFFDKMQKCDVFVIRDEVIYIKKEYHNRNRIRINGNDVNNPQFKWINIPVFSVEDYIRHILIKKDFRLKNKTWNEVLLNEIKSAYSGSDYFDEFFPEIERIFDNSNDKLIELNMKIINFLKEVFGIECRVIMASDLGLRTGHYSESSKTDASEDLANICEALKGDVYLSGSGGKDYLNLNPFNKKRIRVAFQDFKHPIYKQRFQGFIPNMSAIDALFCAGGLLNCRGIEKNIKEYKEEIMTIRT